MSSKLPIVDQRTSPEPSLGTLARHRLAHLGELKVGRSILDARLAGSCDSSKCTSRCCGTGVYADRAEKELILSHAAEVIRTMDPDQPRDPLRWFDDDELHDPDFPSGVAVGTQTIERGCVFLDQRGRCVLQKANLEGRVPVLKPFYCTAFPITIDQATLVLDIDNVEGSRDCCQPSEDGARSVLDAFGYELEFVLGPDGVAELRAVLEAAVRRG